MFAPTNVHCSKPSGRTRAPVLSYRGVAIFESDAGTAARPRASFWQASQPLTRPGDGSIVSPPETPLSRRGSTMPESKVPFYGHVRQYRSIKKEIDDAILSVLESNQYVMGPALKQFEQELARYSGTRHAIGVNSGTDALWLVFLALGVKPGDEIITTANTFFATAEGIWIARAKAVFVDCDPRTRNIDL